METKKELKNKLEELIKTNEIVVGVYQNDSNKNNKLKLVNVWGEVENNKKQFMAFLYRKTILKSADLKVKYQYNYSDKQIITFRETYTNFDDSKTITEFKFFNIPTSLGYLDIYKL